MSRPRILIADDDPDFLCALAAAIEGWGAEVVSASNGADLIERLADAPYTLVVTDVSMPWMGGLQAMHSARYAGLRTPIIVMTGLADAKIPEHVAALGERAVLLRKPFVLSDLKSAMRALLPPDENLQVEAL